MINDLFISEKNFDDGISQLEQLIDGGDISFSQLKSSFENTFVTLWEDWHTPAGLAFKNKFEKELIKGIEDYIVVLETLIKDLKVAKLNYTEVFDAADELKNAEFPNQ